MREGGRERKRDRDREREKEESISGTTETVALRNGI